MDPAGDPSLKISGMRTVSLREKWKNYSRKSTTSTTMQKVLESTHLNKQSIFKDTLKKQLSNLQSFQNQFCGHDMTTRSFGVGFSNANHSLKNTRVGFFGEIGVFLANKLSWTLWNHHLLIYIYTYIYKYYSCQVRSHNTWETKAGIFVNNWISRLESLMKPALHQKKQKPNTPLKQHTEREKTKGALGTFHILEYYVKSAQTLSFHL